jgi:uncharacterized protein YbjT (DUF2867 family)
MSKHRTAIVFGATGACGRELIMALSQNEAYSKVTAVIRRSVELPPTIATHIISDLDANKVDQLSARYDAVFCCLGTTMKQAGSQSAFRAVDEHLIKSTIDYAVRTQAAHFHLISSVGANENAIAFYSRIKGNVENYLKAQNIRWTIYRPSVLKREVEGEFRLGEKLAELIMAPLKWLPGLRRLAPVSPKTLAASMIARDLNQNAPYPYFEERA